ncbi:hypothetical protein ABPG72_020046 [Tetrahymena utriculariae]
MPRALSPYSRGIIEGHRQAGKKPQESLDLLQERQKMRGKEITKSVKIINNLFQKSIDEQGEMHNNYQNCGTGKEYSEQFNNTTKKHFKESLNESLWSFSKNEDLNPKELSQIISIRIKNLNKMASLQEGKNNSKQDIHISPIKEIDKIQNTYSYNDEESSIKSDGTNMNDEDSLLSFSKNNKTHRHKQNYLQIDEDKQAFKNLISNQSVLYPKDYIKQNSDNPKYFDQEDI